MRPAWAAVAVFLVSCAALWSATPDGDVVELRGYGHAVLDGRLPYRDFQIEYPPGAIPLFTLPALGHYVTWFRLENALAWAAVVVLAGALARDWWPPFAVALTPLALGPLALMRFDAWAAALALGALLALVRRRPSLALALLAAGTLVKVWPLALLPLFVLYGVPRRSLAWFGGVLAAGLVPFAALAHAGAYNAVAQQANRHLQLESLASSVLLALGRPVRVFFDAGSWNVAGSGADALAKAHSLLQVAAVVAIAFLFARSRRTPAALVGASSVTVVAVAFLGKVLSPQYILWAAPFASLLDVPAAVLVLVAAAVTRLIFPGRYDELRALDGGAVALLAARNALLVAAVAAAAAGAARARRR